MIPYQTSKKNDSLFWTFLYHDLAHNLDYYFPKPCWKILNLSRLRNYLLSHEKRQALIFKNLGAKVFSANLAKVLNILITSLNTCVCKGREHVAKIGENRQRTTKRYQKTFKLTILPSEKNQLNEEKFCNHNSEWKPAAFYQMPPQNSKVPKVDN